MYPVFDKREKAQRHAVAKGETLQKLAEKYAKQGNDFPKDLDWRTLALFNWGTAEPSAVRRILCESLGAARVFDLSDASLDPAQIELDPAHGPDGEKVVWIPKLWKKSGLDTQKTHTIKVRRRMPMTAVSITRLDKWFVPGAERCEIKYRLEGLKEAADKVVLEVYGSNYCECTAWNNGLGTYPESSVKDLSEVPLFTLSDGNQSLPGGPFAIKADGKDGWDGKVTAAKGMLAVKTDNQPRLINVAFSPYTVLLRYYPQKQDADKKFSQARILLHPFWPKFDPTTKKVVANDEALKIRWEIKNTDKLEQGWLEITDKNDHVVFVKPLTKDQVTAGQEKSIAWDGKYNVPQTDGKTEAAPDLMPYRVQIQAHTGPDKELGLALAAMHTEVRLYVAPATRLASEENYEPALVEPQSAWFSLASLYLGDQAPDDPNKLEWTQYHLAEAGFHAGPIDGQSSDCLKAAVKEFQRSVPKHKTGAKYERQAVGGLVLQVTKDALEHMDARYRRPWFGNPESQRADLPHATAQEIETINQRLNDPTKGIIAWVDWRGYYTKSDSDQKLVKVDQFRSGMERGDGVVTDDEKIVCRPWIPLRVAPQLLSRTTTGLNETVAQTTDPDQLKQMRRALGPLRVDWTFNELPVDLTPILDAPHKKERVRTRRFVQWAIDNFKQTYSHKNPKRDVTFTNCTVAQGGIRPDVPTGGTAAQSLKNYYRAPIGHEDKTRLKPWHSVPHDDTESIVTVIHDHLVKTQPKDAEPLDKKNVGFAGVFFRPSTIGGDGYQVRAQVRFDKLAGSYEFPNLKVLAARYPRLPQANTAAVRVWRKSSFRARIEWGASDNHFDTVRSLYSSGHVHFVHELGAEETYAPSDLIDAADNTDLDAYKTLVTSRCLQACNKVKAQLDFDDSHSYPWWNQPNLGWVWASPPDISFDEVPEKLLDDCESATWARFQEALLLDLARRIEERDGRLRGHILAPYSATGDVYAQKYRCQSCRKAFFYIEKNGTGNAASGFKCESCAKTGNNGIQPDGACRGRYRCTTCNALCWGNDDWYPNGGRFTNGTGPCGHANKLTLVTVQVTTAAPAPQQTRVLVNYGIGNPGGVIWVIDGMKGWEWAHEVGHNRHLEHAASAPVGGRTAERSQLHDSEENHITEWPQAKFDCDAACGKTQYARPSDSPNCACGSSMSDSGTRRAYSKDEQWDRCCIMSYVDLGADYDAGEDITYFCGKCVLRARGWKVQTIAGGPGPDQTLP